MCTTHPEIINPDLLPSSGADAAVLMQPRRPRRGRLWRQNGRFGGHARRERPSPRLTIKSWKLASRLFSGGNRAQECQCGGVTCRARRTFGEKNRVRGWDRQAIFFGERGNFVWLIVSLAASLELIFHAVSPPVLRPCPLLGQTQKFNHRRPAQVQQLGIVLKRYILKSRSNGGCRRPRGIERQAWQPRRRACRHRRDRIVRSCREMVGVEKFELPTLWSQTRCATRLRYTPRPCGV